FGTNPYFANPRCADDLEPLVFTLVWRREMKNRQLNAADLAWRARVHAYLNRVKTTVQGQNAVHRRRILRRGSHFAQWRIGQRRIGKIEVHRLVTHTNNLSGRGLPSLRTCAHRQSRISRSTILYTLYKSNHRSSRET